MYADLNVTSSLQGKRIGCNFPGRCMSKQMKGIEKCNTLHVPKSHITHMCNVHLKNHSDGPQCDCTVFFIAVYIIHGMSISKRRISTWFVHGNANAERTRKNHLHLYNKQCWACAQTTESNAIFYIVVHVFYTFNSTRKLLYFFF